MDVSIIIVNYNTANLVFQCIESIKKYTINIDYEIIVVDNASHERKIEVLAQSKDIVFIQNDKNLGFGSANNIGAKKAIGVKLLFLNSDTILLNNAVLILSKYLDENPKTAICGGNLYSQSNEQMKSFSHFFPSVIETIDELCLRILSTFKYNNSKIFNNTKSDLEVSYISGADLMIRKNIFDQMKGFDEHFFMYYEETYLCYLVKKAEFSIKSVPTAKIVHLEGASYNKTSAIAYKRIDQQFASRKIFFNKSYNKYYVILEKSLFKILIMQRLLIYKIIRNKYMYDYWKYIYRII